MTSELKIWISCNAKNANGTRGASGGHSVLLSGRQMKSLSPNEKLDFAVLGYNLYGTDPSHWVRMCLLLLAGQNDCPDPVQPL